MIVIPSSRGVTASSIFNPNSLDGLVMWMDAGQNVNIVGAENQVEEWACRQYGTPFIPDFTSTDITWVPSDPYLNNQPSINFSTSANNGAVGIYSDSSSVLTTIASVFIVYTMLGSNGFEYQVIYENDGLNLYTERQYSNKQFGTYLDGQFADADTVSTLSAGYIRSVRSADGTDVFFQVNGIGDGDVSGPGFYNGRTQVVIGNGGLRVGAGGGFNQPFTGRIAEIIAYDTYHTLPDVSKVEAYLNAKYRLY